MRNVFLSLGVGIVAFVEIAAAEQRSTEVRWEQLMIRFDQYSTLEDANREIAKMGNNVLRGQSLADVAQSSSHGPNARKGGYHDWTRIDSVKPDAVAQALRSLPKGRLSQIIRSQNGFHIVRVIDRRKITRPKPDRDQRNRIPLDVDRGMKVDELERLRRITNRALTSDGGKASHRKDIPN